MLKNKIIALVSAVTMLFSIATVANAVENPDKTKVILNPTFFAELAQKNPNNGQCMYNLGVNYTFEGTDPITYAKTAEDDGWGGTVTTYSGLGFKVVDMNLNPDIADKIVRVNNATNTNMNTIWISNTSTTDELFAPSKKTDSGYVFFTVITSEEVEFECTQLTLNLVDYGTTPAEKPSAKASYKYSSDVAMVDGGNADFYAYTTPQTQEPVAKAITVTGGRVEGGLTEALEGAIITVIADIPSGKQIKSVTGAADLTEQSAGVYTFTMPAEAVTIVFEYEDIPQFSATPSDLAPYYTADKAEFSRKQVTMLNRTAPNLTVEFVDAESVRAPKTFNVTLPVTNGEAADVFEAWVMNAPATWTINVTEVQ